jgi:hypothetical protein
VLLKLKIIGDFLIMYNTKLGLGKVCRRMDTAEVLLWR